MIILLCNDQNRHSFKLSFIYILCFMEKVRYNCGFIKILKL